MQFPHELWLLASALGFKVHRSPGRARRGSITLEVKLTGVVYENFHEIIDLELEEEQEEHLPSNVYSIAESSFSTSFHPRAIWHGEEIVGFLMYQFGEQETEQHECTIWRFMIDRRHQNKGIGKAAMALLMEEIKESEQCKMVEIYYDENNIAAKKLYTQYGFKVVGSRDDGDVIAEVEV